MKRVLCLISAAIICLCGVPALALPMDDMPSHMLPFEQLVGDNGDYVTQPGDWPPGGTYNITIDVNNQVVTVYRTETGEIVRQCLCSTGTTKTPSPLGTFTMPEQKRRRFSVFPGYIEYDYGQYMTMINAGSWFHSVIYSELDASAYTVSYSRLGNRASHGCIRLPAPDARWIYFNVAPGTKVLVTESIPKNSELVKKLALPKAPSKRPSNLNNVPQIFAKSAPDVE